MYFFFLGRWFIYLYDNLDCYRIVYPVHPVCDRLIWDTGIICEVFFESDEDDEEYE